MKLIRLSLAFAFLAGLAGNASAQGWFMPDQRPKAGNVLTGPRAAINLGKGLSSSLSSQTATVKPNQTLYLQTLPTGPQTGTTYTIAPTDINGIAVFTGTVASTWTLPTAGSPGFENGNSVTIQNSGTANITLSSASTISGPTVIAPNGSVTATSDTNTTTTPFQWDVGGYTGLATNTVLPATDIIVGSAGNVGTAVAVSGDATISNTGSLTVTKTSGTAFGTFATQNYATPPAIGGTTPAGGAFSTLSASSTVSGAGFSTYLASPPAIGGSSPAAGHFTTLSATGETTTAASAAGSSGLTITPGTAPASPVNGDIWTTSSGIYVQINGSTVGPLASSAGSSLTVGTTTIGGTCTNGYALYNNSGTLGCIALTGSGTVTSVAASGPSGFLTWSGSPVTSAGTLTAALNTQTANTVFAGPTTGSAASPTFRGLVAADIPATSIITAYSTSCTTASPCTWTMGTNTTKIQVWVCGGGGGGGYGGTTRGGSGGAAGWCPNMPSGTFTASQLTPSQTLSVGAGGTGGIPPSTAATIGGSTCFGNGSTCGSTKVSGNILYAGGGYFGPGNAVGTGLPGTPFDVGQTGGNTTSTNSSSYLGATAGGNGATAAGTFSLAVGSLNNAAGGSGGAGPLADPGAVGTFTMGCSVQGAAGAAGANGGSPTAIVSGYYGPGCPGGSGGGGTTGNGGNGGAGVGYGSGGSGGAGSASGTPGSGAAGLPGFILVVESQ